MKKFSGCLPAAGRETEKSTREGLVMVFSNPILVTLRVPVNHGDIFGSVAPFLQLADEVRKAVGRRFDIDPEGVIYQVVPVFGEAAVVVEVTKVPYLRQSVLSDAVYLVAGDLLKVFEPTVAKSLGEDIQIDIFAETFKDDIDKRAHARAHTYRRSVGFVSDPMSSGGDRAW